MARVPRDAGVGAGDRIRAARGAVKLTSDIPGTHNDKETAMKALLMVVAAAGTLIAGGVNAQSGADVLKAKGCLNCHEMAKKKVGPAYKDVAAKYKGDASAEGKLIAKIKEGKTHPKVAASDAELKAAVSYVLAQ
jgi:cytochrome c